MPAFTDGVHLVAETLDDLHEFAQAIGLKREWFQDHPRHPHYDLTTIRAVRRAINRGAVLVSPEIVLQLAHGLASQYKLTVAESRTSDLTRTPTS
jgi:hypothetical protein